LGNKAWAMETSKILFKYSKKLAKKIRKILKKSPDQFHVEDYHLLRIEIKKLNALFDLLQFCSEHFNRKKYFKPAKKIFAQVGKMRELQLEEASLKKYVSFSIEHYLHDIQKQIKKEETNFHALISKKRKALLKKDLQESIPFLEEASQKKVIIYFEKKRKEISDIIRKRPLRPLQVHELRKKLKTDFYNKQSCRMPRSPQLEEEDHFQELLGKWHDSRTMNDLLKKSILHDEIDPTELNQLIEIHYEISVGSGKLLKEINALLDSKLSFG
jgi:CHAD domain-containing protein